MEQSLFNKYQLLWDTAIIRPSKLESARRIAERIKGNKIKYVNLVDNIIKAAIPTSSIPWYFVGLIHSLEADLLFDRHLHNGDSLKARTVHVPAGRPKVGNPPFTWNQSATDALVNVRGLHKIEDWRIPSMLYLLEGFNGYGYLKRGINSPYLWSGTSQYGEKPNIGKYVSDGKFDPHAISSQTGCVAILKMIV